MAVPSSVNAASSSTKALLKFAQLQEQGKRMDKPKEVEMDRENQREDEEEQEEEDYVVREIDVFFNPSIDENTKLFLLQFPLRQSSRPYEMMDQCEEVRVNTETNKVEMDLPVDTNSSNFNTEFGKKYNYTKQTLKTTWRPAPCSDYSIGVLVDDQLHLNPVHAIPQLRPSMDYLNSTNEPVLDENWKKLKYHGLDSEFSSKYLNRMMANGDSQIDFNMSPDAYISSLCPGGSSRNSKSKDSLKRALTSLPLEDRLRKLLCEGCPVFRYSVLKQYALEYSDEDFLRFLQQEAVLVQGLWTAKTTLLKLQAPVAAARDYVLSLFSKDSTIKYSVVESSGILKGAMKDMLGVLAKERPLLSDYKFKEPADDSFIKSYPGIVEDQNVAWAAIETKIQEMMRALKKNLKDVLQTRKVCSFETICQGLRDCAVSTSNQPKPDYSLAQLVAWFVDSNREELEQVISEVAVNIHGTIVRKSCSWQSGFDPLRRVVIGLFLRSAPGARLLRADIIKELDRVPKNHEYNTVMHDLCEYNQSSGGWGLKKPQ